MSEKLIYLFNEGNAGMRMLLGGKGANIAEMTAIGLPVPPGFTLTTDACKLYFEHGKKLPDQVVDGMFTALATVEKSIGKTFGDEKNPLLVSVRSGAPVSMPGMMDTVLNLGLNEKTVAGLAEATGNRRFALDSYRRFIQMFGSVVMGLEHFEFEMLLEAVKRDQNVEIDKDLSEQSLEKIIADYKQMVFEKKGVPFPSDVRQQLLMAVNAVFDSWYNPRADVYRKLNKIDESIGTAVNVQSMVFGNMGDDSGTGVAFTRSPSTGEKALYGEYLMNAQGEDVVAGIRTPHPITRLQSDMPLVYDQFVNTCATLEKHYRDMQDIEFTIQDGKLYILQTRNGKRTAAAAVKAAVDMANEGLITVEEAIMRVEPDSLEQLLHRQLDPDAPFSQIAQGLPASPGAATGHIVFDANVAESRGKLGEKVILVRNETTPDDIHGIINAQGILTSRGGMTSHAAVIARGMGKSCICGCSALDIRVDEKVVIIGDLTLKENDIITLDSTQGRVALGAVALIDPQLGEEFKTFLGWAAKTRKMGVKANADNGADAAKARELGAEGIGLCRTEHMFMDPNRLPVIQSMILAQTPQERIAHLEKLEPFQQADFYEILKAMDGLGVTIRLLDPPLHEFLPNQDVLEKQVWQLEMDGAAAEAELSRAKSMLAKVTALHEANPMLGLRGCRLAMRWPEIYLMQSRAIFKATAQLIKEGFNPKPEVEIPLVISREELYLLRKDVDAAAKEVMEQTGVEIPYTVGSMLELPRACLLAGEIAECSDFFAFGTNDLTQTTLGFSRDDAEGRFMNDYLDKKIFAESPFAVLDRKGVGRMMEMAISAARATKPGLKMSICGEHGGNPASVEYCNELGITYVSCSPYRVPVANLAAAQAVIKQTKK